MLNKFMTYTLLPFPLFFYQCDISLLKHVSISLSIFKNTIKAI